MGGHLDEDAIKELLDQSAIKELLSHAVRYGLPRAEADDPRVTQEHENVKGEIIIQARMLAETEELPELGRLTVGSRPMGRPSYQTSHGLALEEKR